MLRKFSDVGEVGTASLSYRLLSVVCSGVGVRVGVLVSVGVKVGVLVSVRVSVGVGAGTPSQSMNPMGR